MNKIFTFYKKLKELIGHGKTGAVIRGFLFVNLSVLLGAWLGLKIFLPDDFILSKINERLFIKDMGLIAEDIDVSLSGNISINEGTITEKGEKTTSFYQLKFSPSFTDILFGEIAGTVYLDDINNQGGEIELSFETGESPCYSIELNEAPLSVLKPFLKDISLVGELSGEAEICQNEKTYDGHLEFTGKDVVFRGKVPTAMGPLNVGKIELGNMEISADIKKSILSIGSFLADGLFSIDIAGKVTLNSKNFDASRLNLDVRIKAPDKKKLEKNPTLNLAIGQMSKYKKGNDKYAFLLKGRVLKPRMLNAPDKRVIKSDKVKKDKKSKKTDKVKRKPRNKPKKRPARKPKKSIKRSSRKKPEVKDKKKLPERKSDLTKINSTRKLEDDVDEEKKEKEEEKEVEKEEKEENSSEEVEKEEEEEEEEEEEVKEKKKESSKSEEKQDKSNEEDEEEE